IFRSFWLFGGENGIRPQTPLCQECDELRLGVLGVCLGETGTRAGKRCKWLIVKPLEHPTTVENPRVGGSIPPLATIQISILRLITAWSGPRCFHFVSISAGSAPNTAR